MRDRQLEADVNLTHKTQSCGKASEAEKHDRRTRTHQTSPLTRLLGGAAIWASEVNMIYLETNTAHQGVTSILGRADVHSRWMI